MSRMTILEDDREIMAVFYKDEDGVAVSACTIDMEVRIEAYAEPGPNGPIPFIRLIDTIEGTVSRRIPAWMVIINYAPQQHLFTPDEHGACRHCGVHGSSDPLRDSTVCVDRPKRRKRRARPTIGEPR